MAPVKRGKNRMSVINTLNHPLIDVKLTTLRDKDTPPAVFRRTLYELASLMSFEVFSHLRTA